MSGHHVPLSAADLSSARRVFADAWLLPADNGEVCLARLLVPLIPKIDGKAIPPGVGYGCLTEAAAHAGEFAETQLITTTPTDRLTRVTGVVPDGVQRITVHVALHHRQVQATVRTNGFDVLATEPRTITYEVQHGGRRVPVSLNLGFGP